MVIFRFYYSLETDWGKSIVLINKTNRKLTQNSIYLFYFISLHNIFAISLPLPMMSSSRSSYCRWDMLVGRPPT